MWDGPWGMSWMANSPTRVSPFTVHFCVSQLGWQQWFMKRAWFPLGPASMIRSYGGSGESIQIHYASYSCSHSDNSIGNYPDTSPSRDQLIDYIQCWML